MEGQEYLAWAYDCEKRRCEVYKDMLANERKRTAELVKAIAEEQTKRIVTEFRFAESENHKKLAQIQTDTANKLRQAREDGKALRRCGTVMAVAIVFMSIVMYAGIVLPGAKSVTSALMVCMGCIGTGLGLVLGEIARRITP